MTNMTIRANERKDEIATKRVEEEVEEASTIRMTAPLTYRKK